MKKVLSMSEKGITCIGYPMRELLLFCLKKKLRLLKENKNFLVFIFLIFILIFCYIKAEIIISTQMTIVLGSLVSFFLILFRFLNKKRN